MKKLFILIFFSLILINCAGQNQMGSAEDVNNKELYQKILNDLFINYSNRDYRAIENILDGELLVDFRKIKDNIQEEFKKYDSVRFNFIIQNVTEYDNKTNVDFKWTKTSKKFTSNGSKEHSGQTIATILNNKIISYKGDNLFGLTKN